MPVTGNTDQEHPTQESMEQTGSLGSGHVSDSLSGREQTSDNGGTEVSSTIVDSDPVSETNQVLAVHGDLSEHVQSTSTDVFSDSQHVIKDRAASADELSSDPSSSTSSAGLGKGFQDAFAAFASAVCREPEEESPMDISNTTTESGQEAVVATANGTANISAVDSVVSSAIDSGQITTTVESVARSEIDVEHVQNVMTDTTDDQHQVRYSEPDPDNQSSLGSEQGQIGEQIAQTQYTESHPAEAAASSDSVYFIQMTDASGQVVTSIIDPNDIPSYTDSVVYKQCMRPDGEIETTIVYSAGMAVTQEEQPPQEQVAAVPEETDSQQGEQQIIYAHDLNGHLTPIDSAQSFNDVAPPGKQFVYMQDSTGRIIRTIMDANQTMVPGQQVYYTQSEDGRIITSVMDPATAGVSEETAQGQQSQEMVDQTYQQQMEDIGVATHQHEASTSVGGTSNFNIDNSMSGLSMLAELSHLTAGQGLATEQRAASSTDSNSVDQDEFRPIGMVTRQAPGDEGLDSVSSDIAQLKVGETDSDSLDQSSSPLDGDGTGQEETLIAKIASQMKDEQIPPSYTVSRDNLFVQWQNLDAMCWMDVVLIMLVNSPTLRPLVNLDPAHELASTLLITLLKANRQAQILLQNILKKSSGAEISSLQTGAGNSVSMQDPKTSKLVCKENMDEIGKAINILYAMREKIWQALQPRLRCERGKHNSPVLVLPLLVREKPAIKQMFTMNYRYVFKCQQCGYSQDDAHTKILPSIPAVPDDFSMQAPSFVRNCFECQAPNQRMLMKFEVLHDFVQMHFVKGLPHNRFEELSFDLNDDHFEVTAVVHYKNNPDHFIAWVRNAPGPAWMECDDLKSVITCYSNVSPNIPPSQVHMVMWERRLTPQHTLVMRDTEDTKLLASLVLTVQQPSTQQPADQVARPPSVPSIPATTGASPVTSVAQSTNTGVINQLATTYTPRPRGRGRGSRGSYGGRGQAVSTSTPSIRRVSPAVTQLQSPSVNSNSQSQASSQIIRLPLSALAGSALRGGTPGTRYVLVGNNALAGTGANTTPTRTNAASKVMVVKSQGGTSNISAAQLLQLLQRAGAISQTGTRITTTVTTSGANSAGTSASTTSYFIQQDGTIVAAPANADMTTSQVSFEKAASGQTSASTTLLDSSNEQSSEGTIETESDTQQNELMNASVTANQTISTLPYLGTLGQAPNAETIMQSPQPVTPSASQVETFSSSDGEVTGDQQAVVGQTVTRLQSQQPTRYIQVPNPAGGGTLLCQLGMKDGKMVLVPVDKNTQTQISGTPVLKLSATPTSSPKITIRVPTTSPQASATSSGNMITQIQQHLLQARSSGSGAATSHQVITIPGTSGNKRIQLITVPRGVGTGQTNQSGAKAIIMNAVSNQQAAVTTTPSVVTRLVSTGEATNSDSRILSQSGNIVIRELKRPEGGDITNLGTTGVNMDSNIGRLTPTQTVSVFRDVPVRSASASMGTSLLTPSPSKQQKPQENFRYILPGSNMTHILHTGTSGMQSGLGQAGKAFTALSSSGTIIGGQLTPSPTSVSVETSPMDQDLTVSNLDDSSQGASVLTHRRQLSRELDTTEYIPLGRSHGRGRGGQRGRGRGGRTPRGRGRSQLWSSDAELIAPVTVGNRKISTLADLRQIGAHVIEAGSETVDGVPVVSIPDFSTEGAGQSEILSAAQSIISETATNNFGQDISGLSDTTSQLVLPGMEQESLAVSDATSPSQGPRVITQTIPSVKANHGFDILTQGILGSANTARPSLRQARSLLTGATTTIPTVSSILSSLTEPTISPPMVSPSSTVQQTEIDTLIQAAQAAAKPPTTGSLTSIEVSPKDISDSVEITSQLGDSDFGSGDLIKTSDVENDQILNISNNSIGTAQSVTAESQQEEREERGETVMNVDESQVSAAERYRMPVELFQPDDESPEKSLKPDDNANKLAVDLPSKLFQDSEISPVGDAVARSPQQQSRDAVQQAAVKESKWSKVSLREEPSNIENSKGFSLEPSRHKVLMEVESMRTENSIVMESSKDEASMEELLTANENSIKAVTEGRHETSGEVELSSNIEASTKVSLDMRPVDGMTVDMLLTATEEAGPDTNLPAKKGGRRRGRPKGSSSKRGGRKKSSSVHVSEFSDTLDASLSNVTSVVPVVTAESSPEGKITHRIISPEASSLQHSPSSSPAKYSKPTSPSITFASDLLSVKCDGEKEQTAEGEKEQTAEGENSTDTVQVGHPETAVLHTEEKQTMNIDKGKETTVKQSVIFSPAFIRHKKEKVSWDVSSDAQVVTYPGSCFNYKVLTSRRVKCQHRHPSLGPVQESFTSAPASYQVKLPVTSDKPQASFAAVVKRQTPRPLQKPKSDPSKDPAVFPLVMGDNSDSACMGGSVITSPGSGETFTGVVVRQRQELVDWNISVDEEAEEITENLTGEALRTAQREYSKQLATVLYVQAGDFCTAVDDISDDVSLENEQLKDEVIREKEIPEPDKAEAVTDEKPGDALNGITALVSVDSIQAGKTCSSKGRRKKRKQSMELSVSSQPTKKVRSSQDEKSDSNMQSPSHSASYSDVDSADTSSATAPSRVNGVDSLTSPAHSLQTSDSETALTQQKNMFAAVPSQLTFHSPSRRSSRTPIPSKKVLDAWDDYPVRSALKDRRTLSLSSDDELSGYSSGDMKRKKLKTKQTFSPS